MPHGNGWGPAVHPLTHSATRPPASTRLPLHTTSRALLQRHPFSGPPHWAGELLHTSWLLSTSMTTDPLSEWGDALRNPHEPPFEPLGALLEHPHRQSCLPESWPTGPPHCTRAQVRWSRPAQTPIESLRISQGRDGPDAASHWLYQTQVGGQPAILRETSGETSY